MTTAATTTARTPWLGRDDTPRAADRAVPRRVGYHRVFAGEKRRIFRGILAIVLLAAGLIGFAVGLRDVADFIDAEYLGRDGYTPVNFAAAMLGLGLLIPWSMVIQRVLYGVRAPSLHSVAQRFRFGMLGRGLLVLAPLWAVTVTLALTGPVERIAWTTVDLVAYLLIIVLLVPLAAAAEEYAYRGLMFRVIGSWTRNPTVGLVIGVAITSVVFALSHGTLDPYFLTWYVVLGASLAILVWRTGGIELAVLLHAVLNTLGLLGALVLHADIPTLINARPETQGSPVVLIPAAVIIVITAGVWASTRRSGAVTSA